MTATNTVAIAALVLALSAMQAGAAELSIGTARGGYGTPSYWTGHRGISFFASYDTSLLDCGYVPIRVRRHGWTEVRWVRTCRGG